MKFVIHDSPRTSPHRPKVRSGVVRGFNAYVVPGVATVEAWPHRPMSHARAIARRIHKHPECYLSVISTYHVPGVTDDRPTRGIRVA